MTKPSKPTTLLAMAFLLVSAGSALAQGGAAPGLGNSAATSQAAPVVALLSVARVVTGADGREQLLSADKVAPGDLLEYRVSYRNQSSGAVQQLLAVLPIPAGMHYLPADKLPAGLQASRDGKNFAAVPLKQRVRLADGRSEDQLVPMRDYRALRWSFAELPAAGQVGVSARARVDVAAITTASATLK